MNKFEEFGAIASVIELIIAAQGGRSRVGESQPDSTP